MVKKIFSGRYSISDDGKIFSNYFKNKHASKKRNPPLLLKTHRNNKGREFVRLRIKGIAKNYLIHVLVLSAFLKKRPVGHFACHKDGNMNNNKIINLYWGTPKQNQEDRKNHGTYMFGPSASLAKLTWSQVDEIRSLSKMGVLGTSLAERFKVDSSSIYKILNGHSYKDSAYERGE